MLSREDNKLITDTNRGQPMGELFRRFWLPVALASELPGPDCTPLRVKVLGEDLIAFRDTNGSPGLVDAYCPHRGAPMFFGRNEEAGLRCVYHGWKFDVTGACVDLPNAPEGETFKHKVRITAYPCVEAGDLIWAYMGPAERKPPFPEFEWCKLPKSHRYVSKFRLECNYLQAMEGDYDPEHPRFLHSNLSDGNIVNPLNAPRASVVGDGAYEEKFPRAVGARRVTAANVHTITGAGVGTGSGRVQDSNAAVLTIATSNEPDGRVSATVNPVWMMPIFCTAGIAGPNTYSSNIRVPIENEALMFYRLRWSYSPIPEKDIHEYKNGAWYYPELISGTWKTKGNVFNDYLVDRVAQKYFSYTGIKTFPLQDIAMMENQWGALADRSREHLTSMDQTIIYVRRRLLKAAKEMAQGIEPAEPLHPETYRMRRESAIGATVEEAVELAKAKAARSLLAEMLVSAPEIRA